MRGGALAATVGPLAVAPVVQWVVLTPGMRRVFAVGGEKLD